MNNKKGFKLLAFVIAGVMVFAACTPVQDTEKPKTDESQEEPKTDENQEKPKTETPETTDTEDKDKEKTDEKKPEIGDAEFTPEASEVLVKPDEIKGEDDPYPYELTKAINEFSSKSVSKLLKDSEENEIYSPISLYYALSMIREMTDGETLDKINEFLNVKDFDLADSLKKFTQTEKTNDGLLVNNSYWIDNKYKENVNPEYLNVLKEKFYAYAFATDFASDGAYSDIDNWALKTTDNMIEFDSKEMFGGSEVVSALLNAVYYESKWQEKFEEENNFKEKFHNLDGSESETEFMTQSQSMGIFSIGSEYDSALMKMGTGNIYFILPKNGTTPQKLLEDENFISDYLKVEFLAGKLTINLPKLEIESSFEKLIEDLDLTEIFGVNANYSKAVKKDQQAFAIGQILQKAKVIMNEEGAKASAVSGGVGVTSAPDSGEELVLNLDRPFIYLITSDRGDVLFAGVINKM